MNGFGAAGVGKEVFKIVVSEVMLIIKVPSTKAKSKLTAQVVSSTGIGGVESSGSTVSTKMVVSQKSVITSSQCTTQIVSFPAKVAIGWNSTQLLPLLVPNNTLSNTLQINTLPTLFINCSAESIQTVSFVSKSIT